MKKFGILLAVLVGILIFVGLFLPTQYTVTRTQVIEAKPAAIHAHVNDLTKWDAWAPWKDEDPSLVITLGKKKSGLGASQSWTGKDGNGTLTFSKSSKKEGIDYDLTFNDGKYKCTAFIHYLDLGGNTQVNWTMAGNMDMPVVGGYFAMTMDSMAGPMFQRGLAKLKNVVEGKTISPKTPSKKGPA
jgi:hypothetical protein